VKRKALIYLILTALALSLSSFFVSEKRQIADGVIYTHLKSFKDISVSIHVVDLDPEVVNLKLVHGRENHIGLNTVSSMSILNKAIVGINAGFFWLDENFIGLPLGILKINNEWLSDAGRSCGVAGWSNDGVSVNIDRVVVDMDLKIGDKIYEVTRLNKKRIKWSAMLYTRFFGDSTQTNDNGSEVVIKDNKVSDVIYKKGDTSIPANGFVYSVDARSKIKIDDIKIGQPVSFIYTFVPKNSLNQSDDFFDWTKCDFMIGGSPVLVANGKVVTDFSPERVCKVFEYKPHPRTAIGILPNKHWIFVVVDGYQGFVSNGLTLSELAELMLSLGCVNALNLDGGSSSVLFLNNKIMSSPALEINGDLSFGQSIAIKGENPVSDAIVAAPKE
jgi:hypothetical protein